MKFSNDTVKVYKTADGEIKGIVKYRFNGFSFMYKIIYDKNHNKLVEEVLYC